jgi:TRAP-type mannitol/chloroaromatic compound transport system substrate-binding protein
MENYSRDLLILRDRHKVNILRTPVEIERAQLEAWDKLSAELSKDPINKQIIESQRAWFQRVVFYEQLNAANYRLAYEHVYNTKIPVA